MQNEPAVQKNAHQSCKKKQQPKTNLPQSLPGAHSHKPRVIWTNDDEWASSGPNSSRMIIIIAGQDLIT